MPKAFGLTVERVEPTLDLAGGRAEVRLALVQDHAQGDAALFPAEHAPCYLQLGGFRFAGLLQHWARSEGVQGLPRFTAVVVDASAALDAAALVGDGYAGASPVPNLLNVFGFWEAAGFGDSLANDSGMPWERVRYAVHALCNAPASAYGGPVVYRGASYGVDLTGVPDPPPGYRVACTGGSVWDAVRQVCSDLNWDPYVELDGLTLRVRAVNRNLQPPAGLVTEFVQAAEFAGAVERASVGTEAVAVPTASVLTGGQVKTVWVSTELASYWGDDWGGAPVVGVPFAHPDFPDDPCDAFTLPAAELGDALGAVAYASNTLEMRAALAGEYEWQAYVHKYKPALAGVVFPLFKEAAGAAVKTDALNEGRAALLAAVDEDLDAAGRRVYRFVHKYAEEFYGRKYLARLPAVDAKQYQAGDAEPTYSHEPTDAGWLGDGVAAIGLGPLEENKFTAADGRLLPFAYVPDAARADATGFDPAHSAVASGALYTRADVLPRLRFVGGVPAAVVVLPEPVFRRESPDGGAGTRELTGESAQLRKNGAGGNVPIALHPPALAPTAAGVPLQDNRSVYGPWSAAGVPGKVVYRRDPSLTPWAFGSVAAMNAAAAGQVQLGVSGQTRQDAAEVTVAGLPLFSLGHTLGVGGNALTGLACSFGVDGFRTTYRFQSFTPQTPLKGGYGGQLVDQARRLGEAGAELRRRANQAAAKGALLADGLAAARRTRAFRRLVSKAKLRESPHEAVLAKAVADGPDVRVLASLATQEEALVLVGADSDPDYRNTALNTLTALIRPYEVTGPAGGPAGEYLSPLRLKEAAALGAGNAAAVTAAALNPFGGPHDVDGLSWGPAYTGYNARARNPSPTGIRSVALRGPLALQGWGPGLDGRAYPTGSSPTAYQPNHRRRSDAWKTGFLDPLWDEARGLWTVHDLYRGTAAGEIPAGGSGLFRVGGEAAWQLPVHNAGGEAIPSGGAVLAGYVANAGRLETLAAAAGGGCGANPRYSGGCIEDVCLSVGSTGISTYEGTIPVVTGVSLKLRVRRPDGSFDCVTVANDSCCLPDWWCADGAILEVGAGDTPPAGSGPYRTEGEAVAICGAETVEYVCEGNTTTAPAVVRVTLNYSSPTPSTVSYLAYLVTTAPGSVGTVGIYRESPSAPFDNYFFPSTPPFRMELNCNGLNGEVFFAVQFSGTFTVSGLAADWVAGGGGLYTLLPGGGDFVPRLGLNRGTVTGGGMVFTVDLESV
jgi:hypothetical protein